MESADAVRSPDGSNDDAARLRGVFAIRASASIGVVPKVLLSQHARFVYYQSLTEIS
jgi:hypothetical protein